MARFLSALFLILGVGMASAQTPTSPIFNFQSCPLTGCTFSGDITMSGSGTGLSVAHDATVGGIATALTVNATANDMLQFGSVQLVGAGTPSTQVGATVGSLFVGLNSGAAYSLSGDTGYSSTGFGTGSLQSLTATNAEDAAFGTWACQYVTTGSLDTCVGMHAGGAITVDPGMTLVGNDAGRDSINSTNSGYVTALGAGAAKHGNPALGATFLGAEAGQGNSSACIFGGSPTTSDVVQLALTAAGSGITGLPLTASHTVSGGDTMVSIATALAGQINNGASSLSYDLQAGEITLTNGAASIQMGFPGNGLLGWTVTVTPTITGSATETVTCTTGSNQVNAVYVGRNAGLGTAASAINDVVAVGDQANYSTQTDAYSSYGGSQSGYAQTVASNNAYWGARTGVAATTGHDNTLDGAFAGATITTGNFNTIIGSKVGNTRLTTGSGNLVIGNGNSALDVPAAGSTNNINISNVITGTIPGNSHPNVCVIGQQCIIGVLRTANLNVTTDQSITINPLTSGGDGYMPAATKYIVTGMFVTNCSTAASTAAGGLYDAASKAGNALVAAAQTYTSCASAATMQTATIASIATTTVETTATLYFSLTSGHGSAATGDVYVLGIPFN